MTWPNPLRGQATPQEKPLRTWGKGYIFPGVYQTGVSLRTRISPPFSWHPRIQLLARYEPTSVSSKGWHKDRQIGTRKNTADHFLDRLVSCKEWPSFFSREMVCMAWRGACVYCIPASWVSQRYCSWDYPLPLLQSFSIQWITAISSGAISHLHKILGPNTPIATFIFVASLQNKPHF